jgi:hypothetical protein
MALRHRDGTSPPSSAAPMWPQDSGKKPRRLLVPAWALLFAAAGGYVWANLRHRIASHEASDTAASPRNEAVPAHARQKFYARPSAAKFGAALVKRGWDRVDDPAKVRPRCAERLPRHDCEARRRFCGTSKSRKSTGRPCSPGRK